MRLRFHRLKGMEVVADREGKLLGSIRKLQLDSKRHVSIGLVFKNRALSSEHWAKVSSVQRVGEDVVFLTDARTVREDIPPGRDVRDMLGLSVTSMDGKRLGALDDLVVDTESWRIVALILDNGGEIELGSESVLGEDAILLRKGASEEIRPGASAHGGFLSRVFGTDEREPPPQKTRRTATKPGRGKGRPKE